jgi:hypothetical protein
MLNQPKRILSAILFIVYVSSACTQVEIKADEKTTSTNKIINGELENNESSTVSIKLNGNPHCTGTIIQPKVILTAGHCVAQVDNGQALEFMNMGRLTVHVLINQNITETANVTDVLMYPLWDGQGFTDGNDAALMYLDQALTPTPVPLDTVDPTNRVGTVGKAVGFGVTDSNNPQSNAIGNKMSVGLKVLELTSGGKLLSLGSPDQIHRSQCFGDSGGPLFFQSAQGQVVSGITSYGDRNCSIEAFSTSVFHKLDWINQNINGPVNGKHSLNDLNQPNQGLPNDPNQGLPNDPNQGLPNDPDDPNQGFPDDPNQGFPDDPNQGFPDDPNQQGISDCMTLHDCVSSCEDQMCISYCFQIADPQSIQSINALYTCIAQNQCNDDFCVESLCGNEIQACMGF